MYLNLFLIVLSIFTIKPVIIYLKHYLRYCNLLLKGTFKYISWQYFNISPWRLTNLRIKRDCSIRFIPFKSLIAADYQITEVKRKIVTHFVYSKYKNIFSRASHVSHLSRILFIRDTRCVACLGDIQKLSIYACTCVSVEKPPPINQILKLFYRIIPLEYAHSVPSTLHPSDPKDSDSHEQAQLLREWRLSCI